MRARQNRVFEYDDCWLSKRLGSDNYFITYYDRRRRHICRKTTHTDHLGRARDILIEFVRERSRISRVGRGVVAINEVLNEYLTGHMAGRSSEYQAVRSVSLIAAFFEERHVATVEDVRPSLVDQYVAVRQQAGIADETISRELSVLRAALNYARKQGLLESVPYVRSLPKSPPRERWL